MNTLVCLWNVFFFSYLRVQNFLYVKKRTVFHVLGNRDIQTNVNKQLLDKLILIWKHEHPHYTHILSHLFFNLSTKFFFTQGNLNTYVHSWFMLHVHFVAFYVSRWMSQSHWNTFLLFSYSISSSYIFSSPSLWTVCRPFGLPTFLHQNWTFNANA